MVDANGTPNHKVNPREELEDHMYCLNQHQGNILAYYGYPSLGLKYLSKLN